MGAFRTLAGVLAVEMLERDPDGLRYHRPPLRLHRDVGDPGIDEHALLLLLLLLRPPGRRRGGLVAEDVVEVLEGDEDVLRADDPLHVLHQDEAGNVGVVAVVGPLLGGLGGQAGEAQGAHVVEVELLHGQH